MRKCKLLLTGLLLILGITSLCSCGDFETSNTQGSNSEEVSSNDISSSNNGDTNNDNSDNLSDKNEIKSFSFVDFENALKSSKPTKVVTSIAYTEPLLDVTLKHRSTLIVEYANQINAKYTFSHQKLNPIGSQESGMISTYTGEYYTKGNTIGEIINGEIVWYSTIEGNVSLLNINFNKSMFTQPNNISENKFSSPISAGKEQTFLNKNESFSKMIFSVELNDEAFVKNIELTYKAASGANVTLNCSYSYEKESI